MAHDLGPELSIHISQAAARPESSKHLPTPSRKNTTAAKLPESQAWERRRGDERADGHTNDGFRGGQRCATGGAWRRRRRREQSGLLRAFSALDGFGRGGRVGEKENEGGRCSLVRSFVGVSLFYWARVSLILRSRATAAEMGKVEVFFKSPYSLFFFIVFFFSSAGLEFRQKSSKLWLSSLLKVLPTTLTDRK